MFQQWFVMICQEREGEGRGGEETELGRCVWSSFYNFPLEDVWEGQERRARVALSDLEEKIIQSCQWWDGTNDLCSQDKDRNMTNGTHRGTQSKNNYHERRWLRLTPADSEERTMTNADIRSLQSQTSRTCHLENNPPENCKNILGTWNGEKTTISGAGGESQPSHWTFWHWEPGQYLGPLTEAADQLRGQLKSALCPLKSLDLIWWRSVLVIRLPSCSVYTCRV